MAHWHVEDGPAEGRTALREVDLISLGQQKECVLGPNQDGPLEAPPRIDDLWAAELEASATVRGDQRRNRVQHHHPTSRFPRQAAESYSRADVHVKHRCPRRTRRGNQINHHSLFNVPRSEHTRLGDGECSAGTRQHPVEAVITKDKDSGAGADIDLVVRPR